MQMIHFCDTCHHSYWPNPPLESIFHCTIMCCGNVSFCEYLSCALVNVARSPQEPSSLSSQLIFLFAFSPFSFSSNLSPRVEKRQQYVHLSNRELTHSTNIFAGKQQRQRQHKRLAVPCGEEISCHHTSSHLALTQ